MNIIINFGKSVNTEIKANNIAIPVKTPKYIVGMKFDNTKIEKPNTIVMDVFKIEPGYYAWIMRGDFSQNTKRCFSKIWENLKK